MADNNDSQKKQKGLKVGSKIKVKFVRSGYNDQYKNRWCIVNYDEGYKDQQGNFVLTQSWALRINDTNNVIPRIKQDVEIMIDRITAVNFTDNNFKNTKGQQVHKRVCNLYCDVSITFEPNYTNNGNSGMPFDTPTSQDNVDFSESQDTADFGIDTSDIDDIEMPF